MRESDYRKDRSRAWQIFLASLAMMLGAEFASAQQYERICHNTPDGKRECVIRQVGGDPGKPPRPGKPNPPPYYPPPQNPPYYPPPPGPSYPPPPPYGPAPVYPGPAYAIDDFHRNESDVLHWDNEARRFSYGSWDYNYAINQRDRSTSDALMRLQAPQALYGLDSFTLENFARELSQKTSRQSYGSALFNFYNSARQTVWNAFVEAIRSEVENLKWDMVRLQSVAEDLKAKTARENYGSLEFNSYNSAQQLAFNGLRDAALILSQNARDHYEIERVLIDYDQKARRESYGSLAFNTYVQVRDTLAVDAERKLDANARYMYQQQLYQLQQQYDSLQRRESYGSAMFNYYGRMRDVARRYLSRP